jgi:hypothetical protein
VSRWVAQNGRISLAGFDYVVGATFAGEPVEVVVTHGLVEVFHAGMLVATHAQRLKPGPARPGRRTAAAAGATPTHPSQVGTTIVDGSVSDSRVASCNVLAVCGIVMGVRRADEQDFHEFVVAASTGLGRLARMLSADP